jgi:hypothetical protein
MNTPVDHGQRLERRIDALLRELPDVAAPASLEERVFARLAAQVALPWWRLGFGSWPLAARILFVPVAAAAAGLTLLLLSRIANGLETAPQLQAVQRAPSGLAALRGAGTSIWDLVTRTVPVEWLYGGAIGAAVLYLMFFSLSALAVRMLVLAPHHHRT